MNNKPRLPDVGEFVRHHGKLIAIEEILPPPTQIQHDFIFEEIEARCEMRHKDELIEEIQTLNDFYGLETSVKTAIEEMKALASDKSIGIDSDLEIVVVKVTSQFRARPKNNENIFDETYFDFLPLPYGRGKNLPNPIETIVWSSKVEHIHFN